MKIAVIGATGFVGANVIKELANRNHSVTAISRNVKEKDHSNIHAVSADVTDIRKLAEILKGNDVVISAFNAGWSNPNLYNDFWKVQKPFRKP